MNILEAALGYASKGMSVIPLTGKKPSIGSWTPFQTRGASFGMIHGWEAKGLLKNVGIVCGKVSQNLVVIDCDGLEAVKAYKERFPMLLDTYTVATGSGKGAHFYYRVQFMPHTTRAVNVAVGNVELRADGCYVVASPSVHPDTNKLYVANSLPIKRVNNLYVLQEWITEMIRKKQSRNSPPSAPSAAVRHASAYGAAALQGEMNNVRMAREGGRNNALYRAALKLGSLVRDSKLDRHSVETSLMSVAHEIGYVNADGEAQAWKTIQSGLGIGIGNSREQNKY